MPILYLRPPVQFTSNHPIGSSYPRLGYIGISLGSKLNIFALGMPPLGKPWTPSIAGELQKGIKAFRPFGLPELDESQDLAPQQAVGE